MKPDRDHFGIRGTHCLRAVLVVVLSCTLQFMGVVPAHAVRFISDVTLDGGTSVTIAPGESFMITAMVDVTDGGLNSNNDWQSTGWRIATTPPGTLTCDNTVNVSHSGATLPANDTFSFMVTAPMTPGIYNAYFVAYEDNSCAGTGLNASNVYRAGPIIVEGCGNGLPEGSEECDDGAANGTAGDCCSTTCTVLPTCTLTCRDTFAASITRIGALALENPPDAFTITNNSGPGITITQVTIMLPANTIFDTAGIPLTFAPFMQGAGAAQTGVLSPANGGVPDGATSITLTFNSFDPGESFTFTVDTDFEDALAVTTGISFPTGAQLANALLMVTFSNGTSTLSGVGTLQATGEYDDAGTVETETAYLRCKALAPAMSPAGCILLCLLLAAGGCVLLRRPVGKSTL